MPSKHSLNTNTAQSQHIHSTVLTQSQHKSQHGFSTHTFLSTCNSQTSRIGRLAAFADSQLSNSSDHTDNVANSLPEAVAEIVYARLVVVTNDRGKKRRREGTRKMDERTNNGVRNFKKFHKVTLHNYDSSCSLCMYIYKHSVSHTTSVLLYIIC